MKNKVKDYGLVLRICFSLIAIFFAVVLFGNVIRIAFGTSPFTFTALLEYVSSAPALDMSYMELWSIGGNWGVFDIFRNFFNGFGSFISFLIWFGKNAFNGLNYIFYFIKFLII